MELVGAGKPASAVLGSSDVCMFGFRLVFSLLGPFGSFGCLVACSLFDLCSFLLESCGTSFGYPLIEDDCSV